MATPDQLAEDIFQADGKLKFSVLTDGALAAMEESLRQARETRWDSLRSPHVFMGLLAVADPGVRNWAERLDEDISSLLVRFQELFRQDEAAADMALALHREFLSDNVIRLLRSALARASYNHRRQITPMDLLITMLTAENSIVAECFERIGITAAQLTQLAVIAEHHARPS